MSQTVLKNRFSQVAQQVQKNPGASVSAKCQTMIEGIAHQLEADNSPQVQACGHDLLEAEQQLISALQT